MKIDDQILLETAFKVFKETANAKVIRHANREELDKIKNYAEKELKIIGGSNYDASLLDCTKGWVWNATDDTAKDVVKTIWITVRDENDTPNSESTFKNYSTFLYATNRDYVYWMGQVSFNGKLSLEAIKMFEMTTKLPELKGIF